ncbi:hypothetical protein O6H91_02G091500 [Diphasiastrum complanatum]|uniref:Uncharacterized protein n=1 Tax=Diphasiastrum complanatum TaxID=34168 RepID=A0ACC2EID5_DIPCM|nr:hypothetical protein O6H91_02G091500 [Diphasiastrum complanatum]
MADREGTIQRQGFIHLSGAASSRKEKKKQVKEERDRLKQAEKKKRRLEKALANAATIRSELEKKKQKRKEEEQRLDKEGAALAEAVALQVLVDEESDVPGMLKMKPSTGADTVLKESWSTGVDTVLKETCNSAMADMRGTGHGTLLELERRELGYENGPGCTESFRQIATRESAGSINHREMLWRNLWKQSDTSVEISRRAELESKLLFEWDKAGFYKKIIISNEEMARKGSDRAKVAEMAAGSAAAQAVAALRIAEEAKAEAEAAKKAAEVAMNEALDRNELQHKPHLIEHEVI